MKSISIYILLIVLVGGYIGCSDKPSVEVAVSSLHAEEATYTVVRVNADLLRDKPKDAMDKPASVISINQGDQIYVLESGSDWSRVQHVFSGKIGWLNNSFIQLESRSRWWSGDTDRARNIAEIIYKDKIFLENNWPVIHINIEERWNKMVVTVKEEEELKKVDAIDCAGFAIDKLKENFPGWRDHQVFIEANSDGKPYTLVMNDSKVSTFI